MTTTIQTTSGSNSGGSGKPRGVPPEWPIEIFVKRIGRVPAAAGRALDATVIAIKSSLKKGDIVTLVGFGSFYVGQRNPRAGRNPRTGDPISIEGAKVPKFRAGKALKDELN